MSEKFYDRALSLFGEFVIVLVILLTTGGFMILYITFQNQFFYSAFLSMLAFSLVVGVRFYFNFHDFQENYHLFLPYGPEPKVEPLDFKFDDRSLQICVFYRNGSTLNEIKDKLTMDHAQQVKRELLKGLTFLLKFYDEHKEEKT